MTREATLPRRWRDRFALDARVRAEGVRVAGAALAILTGLGLEMAARTDVPTLAGLEALAWAAAYALGGWDGVRAGWASLRERRVDIDLLMVLAALGALAIGAPFEGALLLFLFSLSNVLQHLAAGRSRRAVEALMQLRPEVALVQRGEAWVEVPVEDVAVGDVFRVFPGGRVPLDGIVVAGQASLDQSSMTGESLPVTKRVGGEVLGGTMVEGGSLDVRAIRRSSESAIARMVRMVEDAQAQKAPTQRLIDRFEQPYALGVIAMTVIAAVVPIWGWGEPVRPAVYRAMTLMVAASPCALVISTPAAVLSAIAAAARSGVLFKGGVTVEAAAGIRAVAFDKTGTLTAGETRLTDVVSLAEVGEEPLIRLAAAVQTRSEHHLARATCREAQARGLAIPTAERFEAVAGQGVEAVVGRRIVRIGNAGHFQKRDVVAMDRALAEVDRLHALARTAVIVTESSDDRATERAVGVLAFADVLRGTAARTIVELRALGVEHVAILTGDAQSVGDAVGAQAGADAVYADLLPEDKVEIVRRLEREWGAVAFVGDGVNDAPALATATVGVAMGGTGTDVALETADVVLVADDLGRVPYLLRLSRRTRRTLVVNFALALGAIGVMVLSILAVGLPLPLAVVGHEGSTVVVSLNGLRLLGHRAAPPPG